MCAVGARAGEREREREKEGVREMCRGAGWCPHLWRHAGRCRRATLSGRAPARTVRGRSLPGPPQVRCDTARGVGGEREANPDKRSADYGSGFKA